MKEGGKKKFPDLDTTLEEHKTYQMRLQSDLRVLKMKKQIDAPKYIETRLNDFPEERKKPNNESGEMDQG